MIRVKQVSLHLNTIALFVLNNHYSVTKQSSTTRNSSGSLAARIRHVCGPPLSSMLDFSSSYRGQLCAILVASFLCITFTRLQ